MPGFQAPHWDRFKALADGAVRVMPKTRMVAWDISVLPGGFGMVGGNTYPSTLTFRADLKGQGRVFEAPHSRPIGAVAGAWKSLRRLFAARV